MTNVNSRFEEWLDSKNINVQIRVDEADNYIKTSKVKEICELYNNDFYKVVMNYPTSNTDRFLMITFSIILGIDIFMRLV